MFFENVSTMEFNYCNLGDRRQQKEQGNSKLVLHHFE